MKYKNRIKDCIERVMGLFAHNKAGLEYLSLKEAVILLDKLGDNGADKMIEWVRKRQKNSLVKADKHPEAVDWYLSQYNLCVDFIRRFTNYPKSSDEEHGMTLAEIAREAKEGDEFTHANGSIMKFDSLGMLKFAGTDSYVRMSDTMAMDDKWYFTHRPNHCPHCGKVIDE